MTVIPAAAPEKLITPIVTISFPHIFPATADINTKGLPRFSAALLFHPGAEDFLKRLAARCLAVGEAKFGAKVQDLIRKGSVRWPIKTNREQFRDEYPEDIIAVINVSAATPPGVVGIQPSETDPTKPRVITDHREVYAGSLGRASVNPFAYDNEQKGISVGLNNYQKTGDGPRLDGRATADSEFAVDLTAPAGLSLADLGL
jgi:hypothetical protein